MGLMWLFVGAAGPCKGLEDLTVAYLHCLGYTAT